MDGELRESTATNTTDKPWVLLIRQNRDGQTIFTQSGPFNTDEVLGKIRSGEAQYSDHVWKTGFERWVKLNELHDFMEKPPAEPEIAKIEETAQAIISNVLSQVESRPDFAQEQAPTEAATQDLVNTKPVEFPLQTPADPILNAGHDILKNIEKRTRYQLGMVALGIGVALVVLWFLFRTPTTEIQVAPTVSEMALPEVTEAAAVPATVEIPVTPANLTKSILKKNKAQVQKEKKILVDSSRALQRKARILESQFQTLRKQPKAWSSFLLQWKQDLSTPAQLELKQMAQKKERDLAFPKEIRELTKGRALLLSRAQFFNVGIQQKNKTIQKSDDLEKRFQDLYSRYSRL